MAAAVAALHDLHRIDGPAQMLAIRRHLRDGLAERARHHGLRIDQSGPAQMPTLRFEGDQDWRKDFTFCAEALRHGAYFHPKHRCSCPVCTARLI